MSENIWTFGLVLIQNIDNQSKNQYLIDEGFNFDNLQPTKKIIKWIYNSKLYVNYCNWVYS